MMCAAAPGLRPPETEMTDVRTPDPLCMPAGLPTRLPIARRLVRAAARALAPLAAIACLAAAAPALGQSAFSANITFDQAPPQYVANQEVVATINLVGGSLPVTGISFNATLPAGVTFVTPTPGNTCGGTASTSGTSFQLNGGAVAADTTCTVRLHVRAGPATPTSYTIDLPLIDYVEGVTPRNTKTSGTFSVDAGIPPTFSDSLPDDGYVGVPYEYFVFLDGTQPMTITVTGLPPGLSFDSGLQEIVGTPTTAGTFSNVHVHASNGFAPDADATYTIVVHPAPLGGSKTFSPATVSPGASSTLTIDLASIVPTTLSNVSFTDTYPGGMTGTTPGTTTQCGGTVVATATGLTFSAPTFDPNATCTIRTTVRADTAATTLVNRTSDISARIPIGDGSFALTLPPLVGRLAVAGTPPKITSAPPPDSTVGFVYSHTITVAGTAPISVSVSGLPPGLSFDAGTRTISGTPTAAGSYPGTITASNGISPNDRQSFTIVIRTPPLAIVTVALPPIHGGDDVSVPIVAQGGIPPYRFDVLSGALPPGLGFDPQGLLTGVPTLPGTYTFTVRVTDSAGTVATRSYTIVIAKSTPVFTFGLAPNPSVIGQPVVATATLTGASGVAAGDVQVWIAASNERCPLTSGEQPVATKTSTASLASGQVKFTFADLGIDHFEVCATYAGDARYNPVSVGPFDLFVIKGALLSPPSVALSAPAEVKAAGVVSAQVSVTAPQAPAIAPSGKVLLRADGVVVGTASLAGGGATFSATAPARRGAMTLTATYLGDGAFPPAVSAPVVVAVKAGDPSSVAPIPALSPATLAGLAGLVALIGLLSRRRRRR
jgi:hypothetical protein